MRALQRMQVHKYLESSLGAQRLQVVLETMCSPPQHLCMRVNTLRCSRSQAMAQIAQAVEKSKLSPPQPHMQLDTVVYLPGSGPNTIDFDAEGRFNATSSRRSVHGGHPLYCACMGDHMIGKRTQIHAPVQAGCGGHSVHCPQINCSVLVVLRIEVVDHIARKWPVMHTNLAVKVTEHHAAHTCSIHVHLLTLLRSFVLS
jgi:hypothetical protein